MRQVTLQSGLASPSERSRNTSSCFMVLKPEISPSLMGHLAYMQSLPTLQWPSLHLFTSCLADLFFGLVYVLLIYFDCVTYLHAEISIINIKENMLHTLKNRCLIVTLPPYNNHLSTMTTFLCPQSGCCGEGSTVS